MRWVLPITAMAVVTIGAAAVYVVNLFGYADVGYRMSFQERQDFSRQMNLLIGSAVGFDLLVVVNTFLRRRYGMTLAFAWLVIAAVVCNRFV